MKKYFCAIGSALLAPVVVAVFVVVLFLFIWFVDWFCNLSIIIPYVVVGLFGAAALFVAWAILYIHCKEYWDKKSIANEPNRGNP